MKLTTLLLCVYYFLRLPLNLNTYYILQTRRGNNLHRTRQGETNLNEDLTNNLRGDDNFNIAMNRMKAADITQLRYLFDMYLLCIL